MPDHEISVRIDARTPEVVNQLRAIVSSTNGFRLLISKESGHPDLLICECGENFDEEFKVIESMLASNVVGEVFVTSSNQEPNLLLRALRIGIKEFLSQPLDQEEVEKALNRTKARRQQQVAASKSSTRGQIIYVMGSKGGVGTTTVAVNLAMNFAEKKGPESVVLMDMKIAFGEIPLFLAMKPAYDWGEIAKNLSRLDTTFMMNVLAKHSSGIHILPSPSLNGHAQATPEIMDRLLDLMTKTFGYVVIDGGQSLDAACLRAIEMSDKILCITQLNLPCLANTSRVIKSLCSRGIDPKDRFEIVVNRLTRKTDISLKEAEKSVRREIFWTIPNDYRRTMSAINQGRTLRHIAPRAPITKNMAVLVDRLSVNGGSKPEKKGWRWFKRSRTLPTLNGNGGRT